VISIASISVLGVWAGIRISLGKEIVQNKSYIWWVVNRLTFLVAVTNLGSFMLFFLQEKFSDYTVESAAEPASKLIMYVGIFILITSLISGWLADRFKKKNLIVLGGLLVALGSVFVIYAPSMQVSYTGGAIVGAGIGLFYSANWALGIKIVPKDKAGQYLGLSNLAGAGAGAIGAYIGGSIADNTSYTLLMSIFGLMSLLSIIALIGIKEPER
jgi:MFS family permease